MQVKAIFPFAYVLAFLAIILFYAVGLYFLEDAVGGTRLDYTLFHKPVLDIFSQCSFMSAVTDYPSATTPFFYIFNVYLNPFSSTELGLRISNIVLTLISGGMFFYLIRQRYLKLNPFYISLLGLVFLISPYTKSIAIWPITDNLPFLFLLSSLILFNMLEKSPQSNKYKIIASIAFLSSLSYYTRQSYLIFSAYFFFKIIHLYSCKVRISLNALGLFILMAIPLLYLFIIWKGLNPPGFAHQKAFNLNSLPYIFEFITFYTTPLLVYSIYKWYASKFDKQKILEYLVVFIVYIVLFFDFYLYDKSGGVIQKISLILFQSAPESAAKLLLFYSSMGFVFTYALIRENIQNVILFLPLSFFIMTEHISQKYADPIIIVVVLLFLKSRLNEYYESKALVWIQFLYSAAFYTFALVYYNY